MASKNLRINGLIRAREVRLIDENGDQAGVVATDEALSRAVALGLDLVEIAPQAEPPVCRIVDYGKLKYEQNKKNKEAKRNQKLVQLKEVRMQPKIDTHDMEYKTKHIKSFLDDGDKVKVTIRFRGREMAHPELGREVLDEVLTILGEGMYVLEKPPVMEGRFMSMTLASKLKR